jgi:hypothetical protein
MEVQVVEVQWMEAQLAQEVQVLHVKEMMVDQV